MGANQSTVETTVVATSSTTQKPSGYSLVKRSDIEKLLEINRSVKVLSDELFESQNKRNQALATYNQEKQRIMQEYDANSAIRREEAQRLLAQIPVIAERTPQQKVIDSAMDPIIDSFMDSTMKISDWLVSDSTSEQDAPFDLDHEIACFKTKLLELRERAVKVHASTITTDEKDTPTTTVTTATSTGEATSDQ